MDPVQPNLPEMRDLDDTEAIRRGVLGGVVSELSAFKPMTYGTTELSLGNVQVGKPPDLSYANSKRTLLGRGSIGTPVYGTWTLRDTAENRVLDQKRKLLAYVPAIGDDGTYTRRGIKYTVANQMRLRPGVFTYLKGNGELDSHVNVAQGTGSQFHLGFEPETGRFFMRVKQANLPLLPILEALGADPAGLKKSLGNDLYAANSTKVRADVVKRAATLFNPKRAMEPGVAPEQALREAFDKFELDPQAVKRSAIGKPHKKVTPELILDATAAILRLHKGEIEPDDRDSLAYQRIWSHEDLFPERVRKDAGGVVRKLLWKMSRKQSLDALPAGVFNKHLDQVILRSGLGMPPEESNPVEVLDQLLRVVRLGDGAIPSEDSVPDEARGVHASYGGFVDPIRSPESSKVGVDLRFTHGVKKGKDGQLYQTFMNARTGQKERISSDTIADSVMAFPGEMEQGDDDRVYAIAQGRLKRVPKKAVDYVLPHGQQLFTLESNLEPGISGADGGRVFLGAKFVAQSLPLTNRQAPLVRAAYPKDDPSQPDSLEEHVGRRVGAIAAKAAGIVNSISDEAIELSTPEGPKTINLAHYLPYNRRTYLKHVPAVQVGQQVTPGQLLATSNLTDPSGTLALGTNLRVAYVPFNRGDASNYEDAITLSESGAKKLASEQLYMHKFEPREGEHDRDKFRSIFPGTFTKAQLANIGPDGLVKPGVTVQKGDPLVVAVRSRDAKKPGMGHSQSSRRYADASVLWDHDSEGVVTDAAIGPEGVVIATRMSNPMHVGDKMAGRHGDKHIVSCFDDQTEILTRDGWKFFRDLIPGDYVASLLNGEGVFQRPISIINEPYQGELLSAATDRLDYAVTPNHRMYCRIEHYRGHEAVYKFREASDVFEKDVVHLAASPITEDCFYSAEVVLPSTSKNPGRRCINRFPEAAFAELVGWFVTEGCTSYHETVGAGKTKTVVKSYRTHIAQCVKANPEKVARIKALLVELGLQAKHHRGMQFTVYNKALYEYFAPLGKCDVKYVPEHLFHGSRTALERLFQAMMLGDGCERCDNYFSYHTTSPRLANDMSRLSALLGYHAMVRGPFPTEHKPRYHVLVSTERKEVGQTSARFSRIPYSGRVYCVEVPGNLIYVRRNGKPFWCGNCIVPDAQMPTNEAGEPFDALVNPLGIHSRKNPVQVVEAVLGKIAEKTGKPFVLPAFLPHGESLHRFAKEQLALHGMKDTEDLHDPVLGRKIRNVLTGNRFYMRLHHLAESKETGRSDAGHYTQEDSPAKGGDESSPRIGLMELNALLAANAPGVLEDTQIRSTRNEDYWRAVRMGFAPPPPKSSPMLGKFLALLAASGVHVNQEGSKLHIMAMTDAGVDQIAKGEITTPDTVRLPDLEPITGGLFDRGITGGHGGDRFGRIELGVKIPNPVMEDPIRKLLGLTENGLRDILAGKQELHGETGPGAIEEALGRLNIEREMESTRQRVRTARRTPRDQAIKKLRILEMLGRTGLKPADLMISKLAVLPPTHRPISMSNDVPLVSGANLLYKDLLTARDNYRGLLKDLGPAHSGEELVTLYDAAKAVVGLGDPINRETAQRRAKGLLSIVFGSGGPKTGLLQRKLMGRTVNLGGRAVITPDPRLNMDQVMVPEDTLWKSFAPFVMRRLVRRGIKPLDAAKAMVDRTPAATSELHKELAARPVFVNRAPSLHKFSIMGAWAIPTKGHSLRISPVITSSLGADFDGDQQLASVLIKLSPSATLNLRKKLGPEYLEDRRMASRFNTVVPSADESGDVFLFDLSEFPADELLASKDTDKGRIDFHSVPDGVRVVAYDEATNKLVWAPVAGWSRHYDREVVLVELMSGRQIITDDDPRAVYGVGRGGVTPGRFTPQQALQETVMVPTVISLDGAEYPSGPVEFQVGPQSDHDRATRIKESISLSQEFGYVLGVMAGDGWVSQRSDGTPSQISVAGTDEHVFQQFDACLTSFFGSGVPEFGRTDFTSETAPRHGDCSRITYTSVNAAKVLQRLLGRGAANKHLPPFFLAAPRAFRLGLFAGLMDTDGSISISRAKSKKNPQLMCGFTSTSIRLANEVRLLAASLGIRGRITPFTYRKTEKAWQVYFSVADVQQWGGAGMACQRKVSKIAESPKTSKGPATAKSDVVPLPDPVVKEIMRHLSPRRDETRASLSTYSLVSHSRKTNRISRQTAEDVINLLGESPLGNEEYVTWCGIVANRAVTWDPVVGVTATGQRETGFDLTVPGYETFMAADGVVLSNTMAIHVPATDKAVQEILAKMMPSKQLLSVSQFKAHFVPRNEFQLGLYDATRAKKARATKHFTSLADAVAAFRRNEINFDDIIHVPGEAPKPSALADVTKGLLS